jgi:hypothetical protein
MGFWFLGRLWLPVVLVLLLFSSARGLNISMTDVGATAMSAEQLDAFEEAAEIWEDRLVDPVTVYINISIEGLDPGILGSTRIARTTHSYSDVRAAMLADAVGTAENNAVSSLPFGSVNIEDINGNRSDSSITIATANAKALGLGTAPDGNYTAIPAGVDAEIRFATGYVGDFDYDRSNDIAWNKIDFVGLAAHEIGHALGFVSVTDIQSWYDDALTLHISTLDLWRYDEAEGVHNLNTGRRHVRCGAAEYYDSNLSNVPMSHGQIECVVDPDCNTWSGKCQASHWCDSMGYMMDPTIADGVLVDIKNEDLHAMNYIGWNRGLFINPYILKKILVGWFYHRKLPNIPPFEKEFDPFPPPPRPDIIPWPENPWLALRAGFDFGGEAMDLRSGLGYATFKPAEFNEAKIIVQMPNPNPKGDKEKPEEWLDPPGPRLDEFPQSLSEVFIQSDTRGVPFTFRSACGERGCPFDKSLGEYGGYRVPGFIDGEGDQEIGDVDAQMTLILLASDESGMPNPNAENVFGSGATPDGNINIFDAQAIGAQVPPVCGDDNHRRPRADFDDDCDVDMVDLAMFAKEWMVCTAPKCP